jgi:hypothetical protein
MKSTGTRISSKSSVPDNCIILKGEVLEYRDSLAQVFRLPNKVEHMIYDIIKNSPSIDDVHGIEEIIRTSNQSIMQILYP